MPEFDTTSGLGSSESSSALRIGWYTTTVLMIAYAFSYLDRQVINLMVGPIKHELHISDTQFAMLTGGAFGIFYTVMGLPIGWLADRFSRKWIVSAGIALWSLMTAACGLSRSYLSLLVARIGVGVGEATLSPSTYSMLADLFDRKRLPRAMSLYCLGIYIGAGSSMIVGGTVVSAVARTPVVTIAFLGPVSPWHLVFLAVGIPGLLVALWVSTLSEPRRRYTNSEVLRSDSPGSSLQHLWRFISADPRMSVALYMGSATLAVITFMDAWFPELFVRTWGWSARLTGSVNGAAALTAGPIGMLTAGYLSARMLKNGQIDACLRLTAFAAAATFIPAVLMPLMPNAVLMAVMLWPLKFLGGFVPVLIPSAIQLVSPPNLRAQTGAIFMLTTGIAGVTLGPLLPALLNDYVFHNEHSLRYSLSIAAAIVAPLAYFLLSRGLGPYRARLLEFDAILQRQLRERMIG
jgi:MFS family permease